MDLDIDKYYCKHFGMYLVHFANNKGLSMDKVREMFSAYGEVTSVDDRGNPQGLCFVKYAKCDDAVNCIKGFKNHNIIKILPHKSKITPNEAAHNTATNQTANKAAKPNKNNEKFKQKYTNGKNTNNVDKPQHRPSSRNLNSRDSDNGSDHSSNNTRNVTSMQPVIPLMQLSINDTLKDLQIEIPPLVSAQKHKKSSVNPSPRTSQKTVFAEEVIVANIDSSLSVHYILHLFEKHNPIAVSLMKKTDIGINYCHVYYTTRRDAEATMKEFDSYSLNGKNLIVLTIPKLWKESF